ncbi:Rrf2 family transcriptional regulator [Paracoccus ravus]|uniref:Rrf2 family transcriptional regulator n=1 Tax=Paracoccus ravus TaxID=2447760 RepID=UPI001FD67AC9|nr:Rrf2 family transcriptional regulator [Paracoccus ravus]
MRIALSCPESEIRIENQRAMCRATGQNTRCRGKGIVSSEKGHGGGWRLARHLGDISLRDVYEAVGRPPLFYIGPQAEPAEIWAKVGDA